MSFSVSGSSNASEISSDPVSQSDLTSMEVLSAARNVDPDPSRGGAYVAVAHDALQAPRIPSSAIEAKTARISSYVVREGDTISDIADMFNVSRNTIRWANDLDSDTLQLGQELLILPVTGVRHNVKSGDTLAKIAALYESDSDEIRRFNDIEAGAALVKGTSLTIPNAILSVPEPTEKKSSPSRRSVPSPASAPSSAPSVSTGSGYFAIPLAGARVTQGLHGYNGIDLDSHYGAPVTAAAAGQVIAAKASGWNGGYGEMVVVLHQNGTETLYAHLDGVVVSSGSHVEQGQVVGYLGSTGRTTGAHLHFEVRGATNPFAY